MFDTHKILGEALMAVWKTSSYKKILQGNTEKNEIL